MKSRLIDDPFLDKSKNAKKTEERNLDRKVVVLGIGEQVGDRTDYHNKIERIPWILEVMLHN